MADPACSYLSALFNPLVCFCGLDSSCCSCRLCWSCSTRLLHFKNAATVAASGAAAAFRWPRSWTEFYHIKWPDIHTWICHCGLSTAGHPRRRRFVSGLERSRIIPLALTDNHAATIEVALDVSADGILPLDTAPDSPSLIHNITIFMYSYDTGRNFTVSNGTTTNGTYPPIMLSEPGSTVKHVQWTWPSCLVGNGEPTTADSARGAYNISIRQNFRLNNTDHYTVFDLPISVTNSIDNSTTRPDCDSLNNPLLTPQDIDASAANSVGILFAPGDSQIVQVKLNSTDPSAGGQGLGGAATLSWTGSAAWVCALAIAIVLAV